MVDGDGFVDLFHDEDAVAEVGLDGDAFVAKFGKDVVIVVCACQCRCGLSFECIRSKKFDDQVAVRDGGLVDIFKKRPDAIMSIIQTDFGDVGMALGVVGEELLLDGVLLRLEVVDGL